MAQQLVVSAPLTIGEERVLIPVKKGCCACPSGPVLRDQGWLSQGGCRGGLPNRARRRVSAAGGEGAPTGNSRPFRSDRQPPALQTGLRARVPSQSASNRSVRRGSQTARSRPSLLEGVLEAGENYVELQQQAGASREDLSTNRSSHWRAVTVLALSAHLLQPRHYRLGGGQVGCQGYVVDVADAH